MSGNNKQDDYENMSPEEALRQMMGGSDPVSHQSQMETLEAKKAQLDTHTVTSTGTVMNFEEYSNKSLKVFQTINDMMGDFFNSIKTLNSSFSAYADAFYNNARNIGTSLEKRKLTEQEFDEMVGNILAGTVINGVGEVWASVQMQRQLNEVKELLRKDALANDEAKYKAIKGIKENIQDTVDAACEQYDLCVERNSTFDDLHEKFDAMRLALYNQRLVLFLYATYNAAIEDRFQNDYPYPNLYDLNLMLFEFVLDLKEKHSSNEAKTQYYRKEIEKAIDGIASAIKGERVPSVGETLLSMDSGLMGVAIYLSNPTQTIECNEDELIGVDDDTIEPYCRDFLSKFVALYKECLQFNSTSQLATYLFNNKAFTDGVEHILQLFFVPEAYKKRMLIININIFLSGILAFISSMEYGLKWYWSLLIGVVGFVLIAVLSPGKSTTQKFMKKLNYVERAIKFTALKNAGYQETIDLHAIQIKNNSKWIFAIIGALFGLIFTPVGAVIGFFVGIGLAKFLSDDDEKEQEYDYTAVSTGKSWKGYAVTVVLVIGIILSLIKLIFDSPKAHSSSYDYNEYVVETAVGVEETENTEDVVPEVAVSPDDIVAVSPDEIDDVSDTRPIMFSGKIGKSPIVLELVVNESDITGKYAYQSTLKKYGDKPESYIYLSGKIDELGDISLVSKMHNTDKPFEYITIPSKEFNNDSVISGELKNANTGDTFLIELNME